MIAIFAAQPWKGDRHHRDNLTLIAMGMGFLPVLAAVLFRTYGYGVSGTAAETLRQIDVPFIIFEILVIGWATRQGFTLSAVFSAIDRSARAAFAVFLATFWIGSAISDVPAYSLMRAIYTFIHILFALSLVFLLQPGSLARSRSILAWLTVGLAMWIPILVAHIYARPAGPVVWESAMPGYLSVRLLGMHSAIVAALALGEIWRLRQITRSDVWLLGANALALVLLFWSGTRSGFLAYGLAIVALLVARRPSLQIALAVPLLTLASAAISFELWTPTGSFGLVAFREGAAGLTADAISSSRLAMWAKSIPLISASPIFGLGEGATLWLLNADGDNAHRQPHNALVQMMMSWGLIGTIPALYLLGRASWHIVRQALTDDSTLAMFAMLVALAAMAMLDGIIWHSRTVEFVALGFGLAFAGAIPRIREVTPSPLPPEPSVPAR